MRTIYNSAYSLKRRPLTAPTVYFIPARRRVVRKKEKNTFLFYYFPNGSPGRRSHDVPLNAITRTPKTRILAALTV